MDKVPSLRKALLLPFFCRYGTQLRLQRTLSTNAAIARGLARAEQTRRPDRSRSRGLRDRKPTGRDEDAFSKAGIVDDSSRFKPKKYSSGAQRSERRIAPRDRKAPGREGDAFSKSGFGDDLPASRQKDKSSKSSGNARRDERRTSSRGDSGTSKRDTDQSPRASSVTPQGDDFDGPRRHSKPPLSVPYTTAASQFIYGLSAVTAALRANRRKLYNLYMYSDNGKNQDRDEEKKYIRKLALTLGVKIKEATAEWLPILDKMSTGRPHNGCVLEASPLPEMRVRGLKRVSRQDSHFDLEPGTRSQEDAALFPEADRLRYQSQGWRYPFVLLLDSILDPGNLGAILRSAYFLGVDAVAMTISSTAPITSITLKASAGAAEALPILRVRRAESFLDTSSRSGWRIYAAEAPSEFSMPQSNGPPQLTQSNSSTVFFSPARPTRDTQKPFTRESAPSPLAKHPCILILGNEGEGLRAPLRKRAHTFVGIPPARDTRDIGLESLNVSVAAAMLSAEFLRRGDHQPGSKEVEGATQASVSDTPSGDESLGF